MKEYFAWFGTIVLITMLGLFACNKKKSSGITPTYSTNGGSGNPFPNNPTVSGNTTPTNPATENSVINIGGGGWANPSCGTNNSLTLVGNSGDINVTLNFGGIVTSGTYNIGSSPSIASKICAMTIVNAPNQPSGVVWYGKSGMVVVNTNSTSINATFSGIVCTQQNFGFPVVTANGVLGCSQ